MGAWWGSSDRRSSNRWNRLLDHILFAFYSIYLSFVCIDWTFFLLFLQDQSPYEEGLLVVRIASNFGSHGQAHDNVSKWEAAMDIPLEPQRPHRFVSQTQQRFG